VTLKRVSLFCFPIKHSTHTGCLESHGGAWGSWVKIESGLAVKAVRLVRKGGEGVYEHKTRIECRQVRTTGGGGGSGGGATGWA